MGLEEGPFVFRVNENGSGPNLLIQVCHERGWKEFNDPCPFSSKWNLWWKTQGFPVVNQRPLMSWQFTNHIPKGASICRKDNLARNLKCMRKVYGAIYDISPHGYNLPLEYTKLVADCSRRDSDEDESQKVWICKPVGQSQGRGIFLFKNLSDLCYDSNAVVQRYIKNPLLIGGYKFDLRLYVCVPSYHPLTIYLYREGLVRFSTDKFSLSDLNNPFCHLTNSSLNKLGPGYSEQKDRIGAGCKWSFRQLRQYFQQSGIRDWLLWQRISALVTLTILSQSTSVPQTTNCFEFYGFDVLIDEKLKPWLLEVNLSPALGNDCDIDPVVKKPLLHDLFDLLGLPVCNTGLSLFTIFSPFETRSQSNTSHSENEDINELENKQIRLKQKSASSAQICRNTHQTGSVLKSTASSAMIVATAATKWRKKRRSTYLFGPPVRDNLEATKPLNGISKSDQAMTCSMNFLEVTKIKCEPRPEEKICEKIGEGIDLELKYLKQGRRVSNNGKRSREDKIKNCNSAAELQMKQRIKNEVLQKTVSSIDTSKKIESLIDVKNKKKKKTVSEMEIKHNRCRESKSVYSYMKPRKWSTIQTEPSTKAVVLPFDKSFAAVRGFKGRSKPLFPMLWGNGRDWRTPAHSEGDWGRIYPLSTFKSNYSPTFEEDYLGNKFSVGDKQIRLVVHHITNFMKISKQIYYKEVHATEEELNAQLINLLGLTGDVWLPSK